LAAGDDVKHSLAAIEWAGQSCLAPLPEARSPGTATLTLFWCSGPTDFYIPTRYPNGLPDLTPGQSYFLRDADQAIEQAVFFLEAGRRFLSQL
jgi:hypothetical protein